VAALVLGMVVVGGATRLTDSGLSITQWKPIMGALPPMSEAAWREPISSSTSKIPQYRLVNADMTLEAYKGIFWWEWAHRLLGRLVGAAFAIPFVFFLIRRMIPRRLILRCAVMLLLGGLQGLVGWWMVSSGLSERVSVAPERLMIHLGLALALFVVLIWTALDAWAGSPRVEERSPGAAGPWPSWARCSSRACSARWWPATTRASSITTGR
jgi:cytochrome c oxidase assembly protein subunit 15